MITDEKKLKSVTVGPEGSPSEPTELQMDETTPTTPFSVSPQDTQGNVANRTRVNLTGSNVIPAEVAAQMKPWHQRFGAYEQGPTGEAPQYDISQKNPMYRPNVQSIYKMAGVPLKTGDKLLPEWSFDTNVPFSVRLPDGSGRVVQASNQQEYGVLLYRLLKDGVVKDNSIPDPIGAFEPSHIQTHLDQGDFAGADEEMYQNYQAGNITEQEYKDFSNNRKTLAQLSIENPNIGKSNRFPAENKLRYISATSYLDWAEKQKEQIGPTHTTWEQVHDEGYKLAGYLHNVKYQRYNEFRKDFDTEIIRDGEQSVIDSLTDSQREHYLPEFPEDFLTWDSIPDKWLMRDSDGKVVMPVDVERFPKSLKARMDVAQAEHEDFLNKQLPNGFSAKVNVGSWLSPTYQVQILRPDGGMIGEDGTDISPELYKFTGGEIDEFKYWAANHEDDYLSLISKVASSDSNLATSLIKQLYPDYTDDQVQGVTQRIATQLSEWGITLRSPVQSTNSNDSLAAKATQIKVSPNLPNGYDDIVARGFAGQITMSPTPSKTEAFLTALTSFPDMRNQVDRLLATTDIPDRVKGAILDTVSLALAPLDATQVPRITAWFTNVWREGISSAFTKKPYDFLDEYDRGEKAIYDLVDASNPIYLIGGDEAIIAKAGIKGLVSRIAGMFLTGADKKVMQEAAEIGARETGIAAQAIIKEGETLAANTVIDRVAPDEFKMPPKPVEVKPGEPFDPEAKYDVVDGMTVKIDEPVMVKAEQGQPIDYIDPLTKKAYTRKDNLPIDINSSEFVAEGNEVVGLKPKRAETPIAAEIPTATEKTTATKGTNARAAEIVKIKEGTSGIRENGVKVAETVDQGGGWNMGTPGSKGVKPTSELDAKIDVARSKLKESWDAFNQTGIINNPEENARKQAEFYRNLVDLAYLYLQKGYRTASEFASELGIKVNDAVQHAWNEAAGQTNIKGFDNLPESTKSAINAIHIPDQQPLRKGFAGNIRLSKFDALTQEIVSEEADRYPQNIERWRRGVRSDAQVRAEAESLMSDTGHLKKISKTRPGKAYNAEEIMALRMTLDNKAQQVDEIRQTIIGGNDTTANQLRLLLAMQEHAYIQNAVYGATAEAGRALRAFRQQVKDVIRMNDIEKMNELLKRMGGDEQKLQRLVEALGKLDLSNPAQVCTFIRSVHNPKFFDYLNEIYINSLVSGVRTHLANMTSNLLFMGWMPVERLGAAGIDAVAAKVQGRQREIYAGEAMENLFGIYQGFPEGVEAALYIMKNGFSLEDAGKWDVKPQAFTGKLGAAVNLPVRALAAADTFVKSMVKMAELRAQAYRRAAKDNLSGEDFQNKLRELIANPTDEMLKAANESATERTFQADLDDFGNKLMNLRETTVFRDRKGEIKPLRFFIPFLKTPYNIARAGLERSPLGLANVPMWEGMAKGEAQASQKMANAVIGSMVAAGVVAYAMQGKITGAAPVGDADRDEFYRQGKQPYSLQIGDVWVSYQRLEPFGLLFSQAAAFVQAVNDKQTDGDLAAKAVLMGSTVAQNIVSQTYLEGLYDSMAAIHDPVRAGGRLITSIATGMIPYSALGRNVAQTFDNTIREPDNILEQAGANTPGVSFSIPAKRDVFGQEIKRESPAMIPIVWTSAKNDPLTKALLDADVTPGFVGDSINNVKLTKEQLKEYQLLAGQTMKTDLEKAIKGSSYRTLKTVDARHKYLQKIVSDAQSTARTLMMKKLGIKKTTK